MSGPRELQEQRVLRWGGLAGLVGAAVFILVFVIVAVFVKPGLTEPGGWIVRFPEVRAARTLENGLYLLVLALWTLHHLALYRALRERLAPALFGSAVSLMGLVLLAAGALPHVATAPLSSLYHAPGATAAEQTTLALVWGATQGVFDALLVAGLTLEPLGVVLLGAAMLGTPAFGKGLGGVSIALGVAGTVAATVLLIDPESAAAAVGVFALIIFHIAVGVRVYRLAGTGQKRGPEYGLPSRPHPAHPAKGR